MHDEAWLRRGPALEELVGECMDTRKGRKRAAIIIPAAGDCGALREHLSRLARQGCRDFDVLIVYGSGAAFVDCPEPAGVLHMREKSANGIAGAYYAGQRRAVDDGYETIILADDDCLPESPDLVGKLLEKSAGTGCIAVPEVWYHPVGRPGGMVVLHHYGCLRKEMLEKCGLTFLPLHSGSEEFELMWRLERAGFPAIMVRAAVSHPNELPVFLCDQRKAFYYGRGGIESLLLGGRFGMALLATFNQLMIAAACLALGKARHSRELFCSALSASGMRMFEECREYFGAPVPMEKNDAGGSPMRVTEDWQSNEGPDSFLHSPGKGGFISAFRRILRPVGLFARCPECFGKDILFTGSCRPASLPLMLMAGSTCMELNGKIYLLSGRRGAPHIILGLLAVAIAAPVSAALSAVMTARGFLSIKSQGITSYKYGVR